MSIAAEGTPVVGLAEEKLGTLVVVGALLVMVGTTVGASELGESVVLLGTDDVGAAEEDDGIGAAVAQLIL